MLMEIMKEIESTSKLNDKSLVERGLKLSEETGELAQAILSYEKVRGCTYKEHDIVNVKEEATDCILVAASIFFQAGGTLEELDNWLKMKMNKWKKVTGLQD